MDPSPSERALAERLIELETHVYAMRAALQALIASTPCNPRTLAAFDEAASRLLARIALDTAQHPHAADRDAQNRLRSKLGDWRHFLAPPTQTGAAD